MEASNNNIDRVIHLDANNQLVGYSNTTIVDTKQGTNRLVIRQGQMTDNQVRDAAIADKLDDPSLVVDPKDISFNS